MSGISTPQSALAVAIAVATETAVLTLPFSGGNSANVSLAAAPGVGKVSKNLIKGVVNVTSGAGTTGLSIKCRQGAGTITGTQVGPTIAVPLAAAATNQFAFEFEDIAANPGQAYTITVTQTGAPTGAGTANFASASTTDYN